MVSGEEVGKVARPAAQDQFGARVIEREYADMLNAQPFMHQQ